MTTPVRNPSREVGSTPIRTNGARLQKQNIKKNIKKILLQFKFSELITDVIFDLFDLELEEVKQKLKELRMPSTKVSVALLLSNRSQAFNVQDLEDIYHSLLLYRTAFGSKQKKWMPINLLQPAEDLSFPVDENEIRLNILQGLRIKGLNAVVKVITYEELIWVMIIEKKLTRRRGIKLMTPVFICYEVGYPYIFTASKISNAIMECILRAMKYKTHKLRQLEGKDIKSLLTLLKHRAMNGSNQVVPYTKDEVKIGHRYFDLSHKKSRQTYVNRVFDTKDPITLETFHVHAEAVWRGDLVPEMNGEPFHLSMTLKSKDLVGMIKYMASTDMVTTPLPDYLQTFTRSAKNRICMKTVSSSK